MKTYVYEENKMKYQDYVTDFHNDKRYLKNLDDSADCDLSIKYVSSDIKTKLLGISGTIYSVYSVAFINSRVVRKDSF